MSTGSLAPGLRSRRASRPADSGASGATVSRRSVTGGLSREEFTDAAFLLVLGTVALWEFHSTFSNLTYLYVGVAGLLFGMAVAHIGRTLRAGWLVALLLAGLCFFMSSGAVGLRSSAAVGWLPTVSTVRLSADLSLGGWKQMLTTLPPLDGSGQFAVLPYLLSLLTGVVGYLAARQWARRVWPVMVPLGFVALAILLSSGAASDAVVLGCATTVVAFAWAAVRYGRRHTRVGAATAPSTMVLAAGLVGLAAAVAAPLGSYLPGVQLTHRVVLRRYVTPPFDVTQYPSPLISFRIFTKGADELYNKDLLTVRGASTGEFLRFAVLDTYTGTVWNAADPDQPDTGDFASVSSTLMPIEGAPQAAQQRLQITVDPAYNGVGALNPWVPAPGPSTHVSISGPNAAAASAGLRYNTTTGQLLTSARLAGGQVISLTTSPVQMVPSDGVIPYGTPTLSSQATGFVATTAEQWGHTGSTVWQQVRAIASHLQTYGAYTDGTGSESQYLPGHSEGRLEAFLASTQPAGDAEQYAAAFALMANAVGMPARVVIGAHVPAGGVVTGQDVDAWVEVHGNTGQWYVVPSSMFMPNKTKHPKQQQQQSAANSQAQVIPPPNAAVPPGALDDLTAVPNNTTKSKPSHHTFGFALPAWLVPVAYAIGIPLLVILGVLALLEAARTVRRRRRRTRGGPERRLAQGWREYVDAARDLGMPVRGSLTRREQAAVVGRGDLARGADSAVFGPRPTTQEHIDRYWSEVRAAIGQLRSGTSRMQRVRARFSLRSFRVEHPKPAAAGAGRARRAARTGDGARGLRGLAGRRQGTA